MCPLFRDAADGPETSLRNAFAEIEFQKIGFFSSRIGVLAG